MSTLWSHIHSQLDHGQSMSFTVTKTGIEGELMITIHPGRQNGETAEWFPPPIFRGQCRTLDFTFEEEFKKLPIAQALDCIRNADDFRVAVGAMSALMKSINEGKNLPKRKVKLVDIKKLADSLYRSRNYRDAMTEYIKMNELKPDEYAHIRIQTCLGMIAKEERDNLSEAPEEPLTDPFQKEGFGKEE